MNDPRYKRVADDNSHLRGVHMDDDDENNQLPVHIILGANDMGRKNRIAMNLLICKLPANLLD